MFTKESRVSDTRNRSAEITFSTYPRPHYNIIMIERGRLITRERSEREYSLTSARKVAREWCR